MDLLTAVNTVLPQLGEHTITQIEGARHPTVAAIVASIDRQRITFLSDGWWFNELYITLPVNTDGQIETPQRTISLEGITKRVAPQGEKLLDLETGSWYFTAPVDVKLIQDWDFEDLPHAAAMYITYMAGVEVYTADLGVENSLQIMQSFANQNMALVRQENLRQRGYNLRDRARRRSSIHWLKRR